MKRSIFIFTAILLAMVGVKKASANSCFEAVISQEASSNYRKRLILEFIRANVRFPQIPTGTALTIAAHFLVKPYFVDAHMRDMSSNEQQSFHKTMLIMHEKHNIRRDISVEQAAKILPRHRDLANRMVMDIIEFIYGEKLSFSNLHEYMEFLFRQEHSHVYLVKMKEIGEAIQRTLWSDDMRYAAALRKDEVEHFAEVGHPDNHRDFRRHIRRALVSEFEKTWDSSFADQFVNLKTLGGQFK